MASPSTKKSDDDARGIACPSCGERASGRFCANCGAALESARCRSCDAALTPGASFCHRCGTAVGGTAPKRAPTGGLTSILPWIVAGVAVVALVVLVAGQSLNAPPPVSGGGPIAAAAPLGGASRAPDISSMSPRERADRLYDRVMRLDAEGKRDSVRVFAPMAIQAYQLLDEVDLDARYDMGRVAEVAGDMTVARAQADTILRASPTHLLGLMLASSVAERDGNGQRAREMQQRLVAAAEAERQKALPEYERHGREIDRALESARGSRP